jgi:hypothetical protein
VPVCAWPQRLMSRLCSMSIYLSGPDWWVSAWSVHPSTGSHSSQEHQGASRAGCARDEHQHAHSSLPLPACYAIMCWSRTALCESFTAPWTPTADRCKGVQQQHP